MNETSTRRPGGTTVTRINRGEYVYKWALTSYRIISQQAASGFESGERGAWHVYREDADGNISQNGYLDTFATKAEAIEMLNVLSVDDDLKRGIEIWKLHPNPSNDPTAPDVLVKAVG